MARSEGDLDPAEELSIDGMWIGEGPDDWAPERRDAESRQRRRERTPPWWRFWA